MKFEWFNALFKDIFGKNYDNVMKHVVDHVNHGGGGNSGGGGGNTDDDNNDNGNDEDGESFYRREFDRCKLVSCMTRDFSMYYSNYI
jgi:hypothetical protein